MDVFPEEVRVIAQVLNICDFHYLLGTFKKYANENNGNCVQSVLKDYFKEVDLNLCYDTLMEEMEQIKILLPKSTERDILNALRTVGNEPNRMRIAVKLLLRQDSFNLFDGLKMHNRNFVIDFNENSIPNKKTKIAATSTGADSIQDCNNKIINTDSLSFESTSTLIYSPPLDIPLLKIETPLGMNLNKNITSIFEIGDNATEKIHVNKQKLTDNSDFVSFPVIEQNALCSPITYDKQLNGNDVYFGDVFDQNSVLNSDYNEIPEILQNNISPENKYHLHKYLKGVFPQIPETTIKHICLMHNIKEEHQLPSESIYNSIISNLLNCQNGHIDVNSHAGQNDIRSFDKELLHHNKAPMNKTHTEVKHNTSSNVIINLNSEYEHYKGETLEFQLDQGLKNSKSLENMLIDLAENVADEEKTVDNFLVSQLMEVFPEACPAFLRGLCNGKTNQPGVLDTIISEILEMVNYPKRDRSNKSPERLLSVEEQLELMKNILPDADPIYLQMHCHRLFQKPDELKQFIETCIETRIYPTLKDYLRKQQISAQQKQYTVNFNIGKFLEVIPDPVDHFNKPRKSVMDYESEFYMLCFLRNQFSKISITMIKHLMMKHSYKFVDICKDLQNLPPSVRLKKARRPHPMPDQLQNIPLLQEIAFYQHSEEIEAFLKVQKEKLIKEHEDAKQAGLLKTCNCCYDEEVMPTDVYCCQNGCEFCKECIQKAIEVAFGEGKLEFPCLSNCPAFFSLQVLQIVLKPKLFSVIALKKQVQEVKAAGLEDLETCPFCDFAAIPAKDDKLFRCLNNYCMKESCRTCKEPSHIPLRCDEVEKDEDIKKRTYIEDKMTEALLRTCYKCGMKFIKSDGCNKMRCSCGALMCYICGKPVTGYEHFNGLGGDNHHLCPLYNNTDQLHLDAILKGANLAKQKMGIKKTQKLKIDPTSDIVKHYDNKTGKNKKYFH